jgi:hypothetical protein
MTTVSPVDKGPYQCHVWSRVWKGDWLWIGEEPGDREGSWEVSGGWYGWTGIESESWFIAKISLFNSISRDLSDIEGSYLLVRSL